METGEILLRDNATALYRQIAARLRDEIAGGLYEPSGRLPSEAELGSRFAVSRVTIRLSLDLLESDGLIQRRKGKGTFVVGKQVRHQLDTLRSFHESLLSQRLNAGMQLVSTALAPSPVDLAEALGETCLEVWRLHLVDGEPVALGCTCLPATMIGLDWHGAGDRPIYSLLDAAGTPVRGADIQLRAQSADEHVAARLGVRPGAALLVMIRTSFHGDGRIAERSTFFIRPERYSFVLSHRF